MLKLKRVRLVNWHYFHDAVIELDDTTLIAGDNGSGKSTIIDAIQYALIADIRKIRFNAAAAEVRTERNLEGYCRCKIGATGLEYYRGDTITHIILEFEKQHEQFLAGVQVEARSNGDTKELFWIMEHGLLDDINIQDKSKMYPISAFKRVILAGSGRICKTKTEYNNRLTQLLHVHRRNVTFNPYFEALIRSVSFKPLHSVDRFVCDYILEERQVDISAMKENLLNYQEAEREAVLMEQKIAELEAIAGLQKRVDEFTAHLIKQEYLEKILPVNMKQIESDENAADKEARGDDLQRLKQQIEREMTQKRGYQNRLDETRDALRNSDEHRMYEQFNRDRIEIEERLRHNEQHIEEYRMLHAQVEALLQRPLDTDLQGKVTQLQTETRTLLRDQITHEQELREFEGERKDLKAEEKEVASGALRYPDSTIRLLAELKQENIHAYIFADVLEVQRVEWQNAVEGWLNTQRCNILVERSDFSRAVKIYDALPKHISGVGLPNLAAMHNSEIRSGSLAELVDAKNPLARRYAAYLLGDVMMVTIDHLKEYHRTVTKECMKYSNRTASRISEKVYKQWYIGESAKQQRLQVIRKRVAELDLLLSKKRSAVQQITEQIDISDRAIKAIGTLISLSDSFEEQKRNHTLLEEINGHLAQIDTSGFKEMEQIAQTIQSQISEIEVQIAEDQQQIGVLINKIDQLEIDYEKLRMELNQASDEFTAYKEMHQEYELLCEEFYAKHISDKPTLEELTAKHQSMSTAKKGTQTKIFETQKQLRMLKEQYNRNNNTYMVVDSDESRQFKATLRTYIQTELPRYREKIVQARRDAERQFKEHFVSRLNEYLIDAKESFSELNSILRTLRFGQDQYSFSLIQKQEKKQLLSVISDAAQIRDYEGELFEQIIDEQQRKSIENLFSKILENELDSIEVREICDYRMYYTYDIKIKHTETIDKKTGLMLESSLSKSLREKSGGETQTPYYVAIAASFFRFFKDDEQAIRLVLFDEAFNKMDDDRIGNMLSFFKQMGIQVLTAVPTEKIETIAPHVDKVNLILRKDYHAHIRDYSIQDS